MGISSYEANKISQLNGCFVSKPTYHYDDSKYIHLFSSKDSVLISYLRYSIPSCFSMISTDADVFLRFADNSLYMVNYSFDFSADSYNGAYSKYRQMQTYFNKSYSYRDTVSYLEDDVLNGEGLTYYQSLDDVHKLKYSHVTISFTTHKTQVDMYKWLNTYRIEIEFIDLTRTKITKNDTH